LLDEQGRGDGRIHSPAHGHHDALAKRQLRAPRIAAASRFSSSVDA
jgi:hypothetical protein